MPDELYPGLYRILIPLPESPLKYLNAYVIKGRDRDLLIDTGLNRRECREAMTAGLEALGIGLDRLDIFITHLHADHFGLVGELIRETTRIYFNRPDSELIEHWKGFEPMIQYAAKHGFPESLLRAALHQHPGFKYGAKWAPVWSILNDNDTLTVGDYTLTCIQTPGHTQGHTCLYDPKRRFLIAGDHILGDISPNIQCWMDDTDPLRDYLNSLDKVYPLAVDRVLPGHRRVFDNFRERIDDLKRHHDLRLAEVAAILGDRSPLTAFEVASQMTWDLVADSWEDFPVAQKWFATGEALSHLRYLENRGIIRRRGEGPVVRYTSLPT